MISTWINFKAWYRDAEVDFLPHWGQTGYQGAGLARYPTDFTRDVIPVPCHSHNDYWRRVPLYEAVHYGCTGVEADVWLFNGELYVGHDTAALTKNRTFRSLYVDPLIEILDRQNPQTEFSRTNKHGVFDEEPEQALVLLVDIKTSGTETLLILEEQLSTLRDKDYLTYFDGNEVVEGPITIVGTGNTPFDFLTSNSTYRDIFFDAPLDLMWSDPPSSAQEPDTSEPPSPPPRSSPAPSPQVQRGQGRTGIQNLTFTAFTAQNSYYASASFSHVIGRLWFGRLSTRQLSTIRGHIRGAQKQGLKARFWDTPEWPIGLRDYVWDVLVKEGADMLNVDDLEAATRDNWRKTRNLGWI